MLFSGVGAALAPALHIFIAICTNEHIPQRGSVCVKCKNEKNVEKSVDFFPYRCYTNKAAQKRALIRAEARASAKEILKKFQKGIDKRDRVQYNRKAVQQSTA